MKKMLAMLCLCTVAAAAHAGSTVQVDVKTLPNEGKPVVKEDDKPSDAEKLTESPDEADSPAVAEQPPAPAAATPSQPAK